MEGLTRRDALSAALGVAAAASIGSALCGCQLEEKKDKPPLITSGTVTLGPATDFPAGSISSRFLATYGIYVVNDSGTAIAIRPKCTHMGCTVKWTEDHHDFECPCHGSTFNILGEPTHGPAVRPLAAVACRRDEAGNATVDLSKLYSM